MNTHNETLKKVRSASPLLIDDMRALLGQKSWSPLSRVESGKQAPTFDMILLYHLMFHIPVSALVMRDIQHYKRALRKRLPQRIAELKSQHNSIELYERISYLEKNHERLTN
jgi:hypothetical protein